MPKLSAAGHLVVAAKLLRGDHSVRAEVARKRIARLQALGAEIAAMRKRVTAVVEATGTSVTAIVGVGPMVAARLIAEVGDVHRYRNGDHFASANGTAPIPASSGRTVRYRLNRGGNRRVNRALHVVALTQARVDPRAKAYLEKKRAADKTRREAIRCLKRHLSDVVFRALQGDAQPKTVQLAA